LEETFTVTQRRENLNIPLVWWQRFDFDKPFVVNGLLPIIYSK